MAKHIAVAGNIGAGKTTLTNLLSKHYGWEMQLEDMDDNPYISDFYEDMQRWSFNLQVYFLTTRWRHVQTIRSGDKTVIQDRTIYEDAHIFAPNLHAMGLMSTRDFENYKQLFDAISNQVEPPDWAHVWAALHPHPRPFQNDRALLRGLAKNPPEVNQGMT